MSFMLCDSMAVKGKPFGDGELIKKYMTIFPKYACPEKKNLMEQTSLSRLTVSRCTNYLSDNINEALKEVLKLCAAFFLSLDENTDISDTAQLVIFFRAVTVGFDVVEEISEMASLSSRTIGQDICEHVIRVVEKFKLNPTKLCGLTTDSAPFMTGRTNG